MKSIYLLVFFKLIIQKQVRCGDLRQLHNSAAFVARRYLYHLIRGVQPLIIMFVMNQFNGKLPSNWKCSVGDLKVKMDYLMDIGFACYQRDEVIRVLAGSGQVEITCPDWNKRMDDSASSDNAADIVAELIALIKLKLIWGTKKTSPLYNSMVEALDERLIGVKKSNTFHEKDDGQMGNELSGDELKMMKEKNENSQKDKITDNAERESLLRFLHLRPQIQCMEIVADFGGKLLLDMFMKKSVF